MIYSANDLYNLSREQLPVQLYKTKFELTDTKQPSDDSTRPVKGTLCTTLDGPIMFTPIRRDGIPDMLNSEPVKDQDFSDTMEEAVIRYQSLVRIAALHMQLQSWLLSRFLSVQLDDKLQITTTYAKDTHDIKAYTQDTWLKAVKDGEIQTGNAHYFAITDERRNPDDFMDIWFHVIKAPIQIDADYAKIQNITIQHNDIDLLLNGRKTGKNIILRVDKKRK